LTKWYAARPTALTVERGCYCLQKGALVTHGNAAMADEHSGWHEPRQRGGNVRIACFGPTHGRLARCQILRLFLKLMSHLKGY
jgi:hypothetical protein